MKTRIKIAITFLVVIGMLITMQFCFWLMNIPSTMIVFTGAVILACGFVVAPTILWYIWKEKKDETYKPTLS